MTKFGAIHQVDQKTIDEMYNGYSPVFILTTGRTGSKFTAALLDLSPNVAAFHEPRPALQYFSHYAFHHQEEAGILEKMIDAARMESILDIFIKEKIYVESNQSLTFFAPVLATLFKKSKFVHLVRHPGDFTRSALRKGWHKNDSIWESGRVKMADGKQWMKMDQIQRLSWLWMVTNRFIEEFKMGIESQRFMSLKFEDLIESEDGVRKLLDFTGAENIENIKEIQSKKIGDLYISPNQPPNIKKIVEFPVYNDWDRDMKNSVNKYSGKLAGLYGYQL